MCVCVCIYLFILRKGKRSPARYNRKNSTASQGLQRHQGFGGQPEVPFGVLVGGLSNYGPFLGVHIKGNINVWSLFGSADLGGSNYGPVLGAHIRGDIDINM